MLIKKHSRETKKHYWIKTEGFESSYTPLYYGSDGWRVEVQGKTCFISDYKLKLLFGKLSFLREVDFKHDSIKFTVGDIENYNNFDTKLIPMHIITDDNQNEILNYCVLYNMLSINNYLTVNKIKSLSKIEFNHSI
jgi:hypothetical protein